MKKIWFGMLLTLFGGMVLCASSAQAYTIDYGGRNDETRVIWSDFDLKVFEEAGYTPGNKVKGMSKDLKVLRDEFNKRGMNFDAYNKASFNSGTPSVESCGSWYDCLGEWIATGAAGNGWTSWVFDDETRQNLRDYRRQQLGENAVFPQTLKEYLSDYKDACWFCSIFESMYDAIDTLVTNIFNKLAKSFLGLMGAGILFLILFKVGRMLVQFQEVDVMQFLNDLFKPLGRAIIATAFLVVAVSANNQTIFYLVTNPVLDVSLKMGEKVLENTLGEVLTLHQNKMGKVSNLGEVNQIVKKSLQPKWDDINSEYVEENSNPNKDNKALGEATKKCLFNG